MSEPRFHAAGRALMRALCSVALVVLTPLLEKNPVKAAASRYFDLPLVLSMARLIVLGFAVGLLHQIWLAGIAGWPDATLAMAVVLAMPILSAMERVRPEGVMELANALVGRFGVGASRPGGTVYGTEPSKYDDHRDDGGGSG